MTKEEKAKAWDEAIERAKSKIRNDKDHVLYEDDILDIFPSLKESDERIRKSLAAYFAKFKKSDMWDADFSFGDIVAWLEKQGEHSNFLSKIKIGDKVTRNEDGVLVNLSQLNRVAKKKGEQKPAESNDIEGILLVHDETWSEEDGKMARFIGNAITADDASTYLKDKGIEVIDAHVWLESLKDRVQPQPKQEWSEEDESRMNNLCHFLEEYGNQYYGCLTLQGTISWIKSFRPQINITDEELAQAKKDAYNDALDKIEYHSGEPTFDDGWDAAIWYLKKRNAQPQSQWKPSESDIRILEQVIDGTANPINYHATLHAILEKLKKLREK